MTRKQLAEGQRIRMKVPLMSGWKGTGRVLCHHDDSVAFVKDGDPFDWAHVCDALRSEVAAIRDVGSTPENAPRRRATPNGGQTDDNG